MAKYVWANAIPDFGITILSDQAAGAARQHQVVDRTRNLKGLREGVDDFCLHDLLPVLMDALDFKASSTILLNSSATRVSKSDAIS